MNQFAAHEVRELILSVSQQVCEHNAVTRDSLVRINHLIKEAVGLMQNSMLNVHPMSHAQSSRCVQCEDIVSQIVACLLVNGERMEELFALVTVFALEPSRARHAELSVRLAQMEGRLSCVAVKQNSLDAGSCELF